MRATVGMLAALALAVLALAAKGVVLTPPSPPTVAAPGAFDTARAVARLGRLLAEGVPHPVDSAANDLVRARILAVLRADGLAPRVDDAMTCNNRSAGRSVGCARVRNIVADIGPATGPALLLVAHYDSTPVGPGAADDGIGVATALEVAHLIRGTGSQRGVTLLLTDGEEAGLIGARAFVAHDPAARRVTHLVNLEARGVSGPAFMFETSRPNAEPIAAFAASAPRPVANSLSADFYRLIPNSTDVAVFDERPWSILNFAIIGNETRYHAPGDTLAALDRRSVEHMGTQVLALVRGWAAGRDPAVRGTRAYADILTRGLIVVPLRFAIVGLALLLVAFVTVAWRRGRIGRAVAVPAVAAAGAVGLGWVGDAIAKALLTGDYWRGHPLVTATAVDVGAVAAAALALSVVGRRLDAGQARAGLWSFLLLLGGCACLVAPGAAIYFLVAPATALAGIAAERRLPGAERAAGVAAAVWLFATLAELSAQVELLLVNGPVWVTAPLTVAAVLPLLVEVRAAGAHAPPRPLAIAAAIAFTAAWTTTLLTPRSTPDRRARFVIEHVTDANAHSARWGIADDGVRLPPRVAALGHWRTVRLPYSNRSRRVLPAPPSGGPVPGVGGIRTTPIDGGRRMGGRRTSFVLRTRGATSVLLQFPASAGIVAAGILPSLRPTGGSKASGNYALKCNGRSCDGATITVVRRGGTPTVMTMIALYPGLPATAATLLAARPRDAAAQYTPDARYVIARVRM